MIGSKRSSSTQGRYQGHIAPGHRAFHESSHAQRGVPRKDEIARFHGRSVPVRASDEDRRRLVLRRKEAREGEENICRLDPKWISECAFFFGPKQQGHRRAKPCGPGIAAMSLLRIGLNRATSSGYPHALYSYPNPWLCLKI